MTATAPAVMIPHPMSAHTEEDLFDILDAQLQDVPLVIPGTTTHRQVCMTVAHVCRQNEQDCYNRKSYNFTVLVKLSKMQNLCIPVHVRPMRNVPVRA
jgi:hypothetical protein